MIIQVAVNDSFCSAHGMDGFLSVAAGTVGSTLQVAFDGFAKLTVLSTGALTTLTGLDGKVSNVGVATVTSVDAKGIWIVFDTIVIRADRNLTSGSDPSGFGFWVVGRVAITDELIITILIHALNTHTTISVIVNREGTISKDW